MESQAIQTIVRRLRRIAAPALATASSDAELIRAFGTRRDANAFEQIVRRHGPMVLGVCRRVLRESADAEDAFQATFLVLVRKANALSHPERLAGWLHQVAHRTARKMRANRLRRSRGQIELVDVLGESPADLVWRELRPIFDDELNRLPDKLRLPAVLCFLEGHSKGDAARSLGWPEGTLAGRLQQARERLRVRFTARGLTLSTGTIGVALFEATASAAVADSLLQSTLQHAAMGSTASATIRALADGVIQAMFVTKIKVIAAAVLFTGMVGTGTGVVLVPGSGPNIVVAHEADEKNAEQPKRAPIDAQGDDPKEIQKEIDKLREIRVQADLMIQKATQTKQVETANLRKLLNTRLHRLRIEAEEEAIKIGQGIPTANANRVAAIKNEIAAMEDDLKKLGGAPGREADLLKDELKLLTERLAWEERMVKKGFMTETQVKKTRLEVERAEIALKKLDSPKAADPRRAAMDACIQKLEEIVEKVAQGVRKGIVPEQELLNAEATLATYKFKLAELAARPLAADPKVSDRQRLACADTIHQLELIVEKTAEGVRKGIVPEQELLNSEATLARYRFELADLPYRLAIDSPKMTEQMRTALLATIKKLEQIAEKTAEGVRKGIVPETDLFNAQRAVLEHKFKLAALTDAADAGQKKDAAASHVDRLKSDIDQKERDLLRAETLFRQKAISQEEIRRIRIDLGILKASAAEAAGDFDASVKLRDGVVGEWEEIVALYRKMLERGAISRSEVRTAEVAVAEARVAALQASVQRQLAQVVALREQELRDARALFDAKAISAEEVRTVERALNAARARLADGR